ncbi:hypothetical protein [Marivita geojedonensis]|uniref:DNA primase n=1 Tax=Marivita geojedonensis TaxID=1123756 RepID=A0A1X4NHM9_9RHOB|nr:hypothetical protein [Marivita geojedonensis]OSQ47021.1 hypothetical protein MGEO_16675 [Marivita geojedonensis]PRY74464.1 hypothetical protein CLV76_12066 [Marivita geojedonensis]
MIRTAVATTALILSLSVPVQAQVDDAECRKQGQIATNIMAERKNGSNARRAERRVIRALPADSKNYEVAIPALVEWIYSLPEDQLTAEVSNALYQACLQQ